MFITRTATAIAFSAALIAAPAFASDPVKAPEAKAELSMGKRVCVANNVTGTMFAQKVCKTRGQWIAENGVDPSAKTSKR